MEDDSKLPGKLPSEILAAQLKRFRRQRGMSAQALADQVALMGGDLGRAAVAKIEVGGRGVSLDEALLLAAALQVAPVHLFMPVDDEERVQVVPKASIGAVHGRAWVRGLEPLPGASERVFFSLVPDSEYQRPRHATPEEIKALVERSGGKIVYTPRTEQEEE